MSSVVSFGGPWNATSSPRESTEGKFSPPYVSLEWLILKITKRFCGSFLLNDTNPPIGCFPGFWLSICTIELPRNTLCQREIVSRFSEAGWHNLTLIETLKHVYIPISVRARVMLFTYKSLVEPLNNLNWQRSTICYGIICLTIVYQPLTGFHCVYSYLE